jgi:hypothetical protein
MRLLGGEFGNSPIKKLQLHSLHSVKLVQLRPKGYVKLTLMRVQWFDPLGLAKGNSADPGAILQKLNIEMTIATPH